MGVFDSEVGMKRNAVAAALLALTFICGVQQSAFSAENYGLDLLDPTAGGFTTNDPGNATRGWRFRANAEGIYVTELGLNSPQSETTSHVVTLFDFATQEVLAQVSTTPGAGWCFEQLDTPVALTLGGEYIVAAYFESTHYYYGDRSGIGDSWFSTGEIEYLDMRYENNTTPSVFPTQVLSNFQYGVPDIGYRIGGPVAVPAPAAVALVGFGTAAIGWLRKRRML